MTKIISNCPTNRLKDQKLINYGSQNLYLQEVPGDGVDNIPCCDDHSCDNNSVHSSLKEKMRLLQY
jgi:hypothetical protein